VADLWGFGPAARRQYGHSCGRGGECDEGTTYSDCGEDILKLVDESDKPWVVDINAIEADLLAFNALVCYPEGQLG
jgi:hypothetical protein